MDLHSSACLSAPTSNLSQLLTLPIFLDLTFSVKLLRGLIHICPSNVGYLFYTAIFNSFVNVSAKFCLFQLDCFLFLVFKTSLRILDSSSFTCKSSLSILYQTVPYIFIWRAECDDVLLCSCMAPGVALTGNEEMTDNKESTDIWMHT